MGDFNIDIGISNNDHDKLEQFCSFFNKKSLTKKETCITNTHKSTIDLILTNKPLFRIFPKMVFLQIIFFGA